MGERKRKRKGRKGCKGEKKREERMGKDARVVETARSSREFFSLRLAAGGRAKETETKLKERERESRRPKQGRENILQGGQSNPLIG